MEGGRRDRIERQQRYIEEPWDVGPEASSSAAVALGEQSTDHSQAFLAQIAVNRSAANEEYLQWTQESSMPQGGLGGYNAMPEPWPILPHARPRAVNGEYFATHFAGQNFAGQYPPSSLHARSLGPGAPAEYYQSQSRPTACLPAAYGSEAENPQASDVGTHEPGSHQSARQYRRENSFLPRSYAPTHRSHDVRSENLSVPVGGSTYGPRQLQHRPTDAPERSPNSSYSDQTSRYSAPEPPPSEVYMPPELSNVALAVRQQQPSTARPTRPRKATKQDARRRGIPPQYTIDHWDPNEKPIFLLGTCFDCDSLGKWIYDWTSKKYDRPMREVAGDLWLVLIEFFDKIKRSEKFIDRNNGTTDPELYAELDLLNRLLNDAKGLRDRLQRLLKRCEEPMLRTDTRGTGRLGKKAGLIGVEILFGRDELLKTTENLMQSMRYWIHGWEEERIRVGESRRRADRW